MRAQPPTYGSRRNVRKWWRNNLAREKVLAALRDHKVAAQLSVFKLHTTIVVLV